MSPRKKKVARPFEPHATPRSDDANAFIRDPEGGPAHTSDGLAESLAEEFVESATTAEKSDDDRMDSAFPEELGGPFVITSEREELARDDDENTPEATREAVPRAVAGIVVYPTLEDPTRDEGAEPDDEDDLPAPAETTAREADPARNIDELNGELGGGGRPPG